MGTETGKRHFIITGTSKGIGLQLAELLLAKGDYVYGISRGGSDLLESSEECSGRYRHVQYDLADLNGIDDLITRILDQIPSQEAEFIGLINNAAMLEPLKPIDQCSAAEISQSLNISLAAPMILSSSLFNKQITCPPDVKLLISHRVREVIPRLQWQCTVHPRQV